MCRHRYLTAAALVFATQISLAQEIVSFQEATYNGITTVCSVDFESTEEIIGDRPVLQLKAALRTRKTDGNIAIEFAIQPTRFAFVNGKIEATKLLPRTVWMRTSKENAFATGGSPYVTAQQVFQDVSFETSNIRLLRDLIDGASVSIGFNYNVNEFDKIFRFKTNLSKEDRMSLKKCLDRIFGAAASK